MLYVVTMRKAMEQGHGTTETGPKRTAAAQNYTQKGNRMKEKFKPDARVTRNMDKKYLHTAYG